MLTPEFIFRYVVAWLFSIIWCKRGPYNTHIRIACFVLTAPLLKLEHGWESISYRKQCDTITYPFPKLIRISNRIIYVDEKRDEMISDDGNKLILLTQVLQLNHYNLT